VTSYSALPSEDLVKACVGSSNEAAWVEFIRRFQPLIAKVVGRTARRYSPHTRNIWWTISSRKPI